MKIECKFGVPHHGWLPVKIFIGDFWLDMEASDVPENPLNNLISSLIHALSGFESEAYWELEPANYYFIFTPRGGDNYKFSIFFAEDGSIESERQHIFEISGNRNEIILPLWQAIKEFLAHPYSEPHWPETDKAEVDRLTTLIEDQR